MFLVVKLQDGLELGEGQNFTVNSVTPVPRNDIKITKENLCQIDQGQCVELKGLLRCQRKPGAKMVFSLMV